MDPKLRRLLLPLILSPAGAIIGYTLSQLDIIQPTEEQVYFMVDIIFYVMLPISIGLIIVQVLLVLPLKDRRRRK